MQLLDIDANKELPMKNRETAALASLALQKAADVRVELSRCVFKKITPEGQKEPKVDLSRVKRKCHSVVSQHCRPKAFFSGIISLFPVLTWLPAYQWKSDLLPDLLAGLTVGIMSIPQGMAYARLAGMPPVYGLYTNIIPTIVYFIFGTTKHAAIGPATVLCLITGSIRYKHIPCEDCWMHVTNITNLTIGGHPNDISATLTPIEIGSTVAFLAGGFLIIMGLFRLSFISDLLPDQLVGGFTVAAAVQVFAGQLPSIFGVTMPNRDGVGKVIMNLIDLFTVINRTNPGTIITFIVCLIFLLCSKYLINPTFQRKLRIPFPGEFLVMAIATLASHFGHFHQNYGVAIVQYIPAGLPTPTAPTVSIMGMLTADSIVLAIVTYSFSISLAKLYAKRNGYRIQATQEFYAYGFMNVIGSFFQCFNAGQSVARSLVYEMAGAKSQLCGMFGTLVVILTVLFVAPFLESLPNAALAAIIVTAVLEMLRNLRDLLPLLKKSKYEFSIYLFTLISVIVLDVTYGLAVSVAFALVTVVMQSRRSKVESTDDKARLLYSYRDVEEPALHENLKSQSVFWGKIQILRPVSPIFYLNAEEVKNSLLDKIMGDTKQEMKAGITDIVAPSEKVSSEKYDRRLPPAIVILDMASVAFMDLMGVNALTDVLRRLKDNEIELYLCGCPGSVEKFMKKAEFLDGRDVPLFPTMCDAISFAEYRLVRNGPE